MTIKKIAEGLKDLGYTFTSYNTSVKICSPSNHRESATICWSKEGVPFCCGMDEIGGIGFVNTLNSIEFQKIRPFLVELLKLELREIVNEDTHSEDSSDEEDDDDYAGDDYYAGQRSILINLTLDHEGLEIFKEVLDSLKEFTHVKTFTNSNTGNKIYVYLS